MGEGDGRGEKEGGIVLWAGSFPQVRICHLSQTQSCLGEMFNVYPLVIPIFFCDLVKVLYLKDSFWEH